MQSSFWESLPDITQMWSATGRSCRRRAAIQSAKNDSRVPSGAMVKPGGSNGPLCFWEDEWMQLTAAVGLLLCFHFYKEHP